MISFLQTTGPTPKPGEYRIFYGMDQRYSAVIVVGIGDECLSYNELEELDELKEAIRNAVGLGSRVLQEGIPSFKLHSTYHVHSMTNFII